MRVCVCDIVTGLSYINTHTSTYILVNTNTYIHTDSCKYTYTHTYIHTQVFPPVGGNNLIRKSTGITPNVSVTLQYISMDDSNEKSHKVMYYK